MPRVPTYQEKETLRPIAGTPARATESALTDVGAGLQNAGASIGNIAVRQQNQVNVDRVMQAEAALKDSAIEWETAARERQGTHAWGVTKDAQAFWEKQTNDIAAKLENDEQKQVFKNSATALRQRSIEAFGRYESDQRQASVEESTKASIAGSIDLAARNPQDKNALAASKTDVLKRVQMLGQTNGWTPERLELETRQTLTALHGEVLQNLVDADPIAAREYLEANKADIAGTELDKFNNLVSTGEGRAKAQTATDRIMSQGLNQKDALAEARKLEDPETRDDVTARLKTRYNEIQAAQGERQKQVADAAWNVFSRTGKVEAIPSAILNELDGRTLQALKNAEQGGPSESDWGKYYELRQQAMEDPAAFAARDLRQDFGSLKESERRQLITLQEKLRDPSNLPEAGSTEKQVEIAVNLFKLKKPQDKGRLQSAVYSEIDAFTRQTGREPSYDERQGIIDRLLIEGEVPGIIFDSDRRLFEVLGTEDEAAFRADIPDNERREIIAALQRAGRAATEAEVIDLYVRAQSR